MAKNIELPQMGESVEAGTVLSILVSKGDRVQEGDGLIEVETDKATTEIPSPESGVVEDIHVEEGDEVTTGQLIVSLDGDAADDGEDDGEDDGRAQEDEAPVPAKRDDAGEHEDDARAEDDEGVTAEPERETEESESEDSEDRDETRERLEPRSATRDERIGSSRSASRGFATPTVRRLARELGVSIDDVAGSGSGGQISEGDVKEHVRVQLQRARGPGLGEEAELPDFEEWGQIERRPMSAVRRRTAEVVRHAWRDVPHVTQFDRADITDLDSFRERFHDAVEEAGGKLTLTAILIKVVAEALGHFPRFNASVDAARSELILKRYVHVGVAVDTEGGLLVPVIRDADDKTLTQVAVELRELAEKARTGRIQSDELQGASFTISNLGGLGSTQFAPIVPWPQVAILAVGRAERVPTWLRGEVVARRQLPVGVSYDHRCIDGADAARFLRWVAEVLEEPMRMTMEPRT